MAKVSKKSLSELNQSDLTDQQRELQAAQAESLETSEVILSTQEEDPSMKVIDEIITSNDLEGGMVRLSRRGPTENKYSYMAKIKAGEFDVEAIKKIYGGGDYIGQTFRSNGQMYRKFEFSIDPRFSGMMDPSKPQAAGTQTDPIAMLRAASDITAQGNRGQDASTQALMKMQSESMQMFMTMMQSNAVQQQQSADRSLQMVTAMMTAMASNKSSASDGLTVKDLLTLIPALVPVFKGEKQATPTLIETIEAMTKMRDLVSTGAVAEAPEAPKPLVQQFLEALPHAASIVGSLRGQSSAPAITPPKLQQRLPGATGSNGAHAPAGAPPNQPASAPNGSPAVAPASADDRKVQLLATLASAARRNRDVELYHDLVMSELEDEEIPLFKEVLTNAQTFASLFGNLPDAAQLSPWFEELRVMLLETLSQPAELPINDQQPVQSSNTGESPSSGEDSAGLQSGRDVDGTEANP